MYVANYGGNDISIFPVSANGNVGPGANTIAGANTGLVGPRGVAVGSTGIIYVASSNWAGTDRVTVYAAGASGNATPIQTISGSNTGLSDIYGIALDAAGDIYVASAAQNGPGAQSVNVFAPGATGNVAPMRTISGAATLLSEPIGVAVDPTGNLYVVNQAGSGTAVDVFAPNANGNVPPIQTIAGSNTGLNASAYGVAWHHGPPAVGRIYVTEASPAVAIFRANQTGNVTPAKTISGALTDLDGPIGIAVGGAGRIYVTNATASGGGFYSVTKYASFTALAAGNNNVAPLQMIVGANTGLSQPAGIAIH
jgi:6-phosphogluconolactonase (cycloisomerase 2 family)